MCLAFAFSPVILGKVTPVKRARRKCHFDNDLRFTTPELWLRKVPFRCLILHPRIYYWTLLDDLKTDAKSLSSSSSQPMTRTRLTALHGLCGL